jgi:hypothetical protein
MHPEIIRLLASEHQAELERSAAWDSQLEQAAAPRPVRRPTVHTPRALRLDRVSDGAALERLAALCERSLPSGSRFVVSEVRGRVVAALPLQGGAPLADPLVSPGHLLPLLELGATQIRRADVRVFGWHRLLPHRA